MRNKNLFWGLLFIIIGVIGLLNKIFNTNIFSMDYFWPIFILIPGLSFEFSYFSTKRNPGVLVPGGILTTLGLLFFFENFTRWYFSEYTWPVYILAVAIGLFQLYLFGERKKGLLLATLILTTISVISFASMLLGSLFDFIDKSLIFPIALILIGVWILFNMVTKTEKK